MRIRRIYLQFKELELYQRNDSINKNYVAISCTLTSK